MTPAARTAWRIVRKAAPWVLAALVLALVARQASTIDWPAVWQALREQSPGRLLVAAALAVVSYALYASFDLIGRRITGHGLGAGRTLATAATSYAFNLNFGALVGGMALRLRLYARWGVDAATAAQVITYGMVTNWIGYAWVAGAALLVAPPEIAVGWAPGTAVLRAIGAALLVVAVGYVLACALSRRRELRWRTHRLPLPDGRIAMWQAAAGGASWLLIGLIVWWLLGRRIDYPSVLAVMLFAAVAGAVTHVPAGLGVLEAVVVGALGNRMPATELLAALLAYRAAYYLFPLALALPAYGLTEAAARRRDAAGCPPADTDPSLPRRPA